MTILSGVFKKTVCVGALFVLKVIVNVFLATIFTKYVTKISTH